MHFRIVNEEQSIVRWKINGGHESDVDGEIIAHANTLQCVIVRCILTDE